MKVSIITVVYNNKEHIVNCMQSVLSQNYHDIEYIVIDGNSTDGTQNLIRPFLDKIDHYLSEKDNGLYEALNKGIKMATGDVIGFLHSDDLYYEFCTVEKIMNSFKISGADIVYAKGMYVDEKNTDCVKRIYPSNPYNRSFLKYGWIPLHTTMFVKKDMYLIYGLHDIKYKIAGDYDISLRWFKIRNVKTYYLNEWVVRMRLGGKSTNPKLQKKKSTEDLMIIKNHDLYGFFTLFLKIARKVPQYVLPRIRRY